MTSRPSFILFFFHKHLGSISFSQGNQLEKERDSVWCFQAKIHQINETTEINTDYEDSQKNGQLLFVFFP